VKSVIALLKDRSITKALPKTVHSMVKLTAQACFCNILKNSRLLLQTKSII